jgi:hypothetical protein
LIEPPAGAGAPSAGPAPSPAAQVRAIFESLGSFLAGKLRLFSLELSRDLRDLRWTACLVAGAAALLLLALLFASAGAALLLGRALGSVGGGFLAVAGIDLAGAAILLAVAWKRLKRLYRFLAESREDLERDAEWLKNLR